MIPSFAVREALQVSRFRFLESFDLYRFINHQSIESTTLTLTLLAEPSQQADRARLCFRGVRGLKIGDLNGLVGLRVEVTEVQSWQLEDCPLRVTESEHGLFEFFCLDLNIELVTP